MLSEFKKLENLFKRRVKETDKHRDTDPRNAYLTPDMLLDRHALTKGGQQQLALAYGKNRELKFSLSELRDIAKRIDARKGKFESDVKGVIVQDLVRISLPIDKQRAKDVSAATLFKFEKNTLHFRVTASGETPNAPTHYLVRVRLEEWSDRIKDSTRSNSFFIAAQRASRGHISFDCGCGRHQFWYRYLATIGGFALTPEEHVFPKIRNRNLKGCCCKHVLKTLMILQQSVVQGRISMEMQAEAKRKGFGTKKAKYLSADELEQTETATTAEFEKMRKAFSKVKDTEPAREALKQLKAKRKGKNVELDDKTKLQAATEVVNRLKDDVKKAHIGMLKTLHQIGSLNDASLTKYAENTKTDKATLEQIAKEEGLL